MHVNENYLEIIHCIFGKHVYRAHFKNRETIYRILQCDKSIYTTKINIELVIARKIIDVGIYKLMNCEHAWFGD